VWLGGLVSILVFFSGEQTSGLVSILVFFSGEQTKDKAGRHFGFIAKNIKKRGIPALLLK